MKKANVTFVKLRDIKDEALASIIKKTNRMYCMPLIIKWKGMHTTIGAGTSDDLDFYEEDKILYVLSRNYNLDYVGLETFSTCSSQIDNIFLQNQEEIEEVLSKNGINKSAPWVIKTLRNYLCD